MREKVDMPTANLGWHLSGLSWWNRVSNFELSLEDGVVGWVRMEDWGSLGIAEVTKVASVPI